ncbi:MAG: Cna B-type domain-containing protein [Clostridia bacterium]|nr:Cna B-type domain-containing protein [Clostridia bacterium]
MKRFWGLLMLLVLVLAVAGAETATDTYVFKPNDRYYAASPHRVGVASTSLPWGYTDGASIYKMVKDGNIYMGYCADLGQFFGADKINYHRYELEYSGALPGNRQGLWFRQNAGKVRAILEHGYWPEGATFVNGKAQDTREYRDAIRIQLEALGTAAGLSEEEAKKLTGAEAITATQAAIWSYTNGYQPAAYDSQPVTFSSSTYVLQKYPHWFSYLNDKSITVADNIAAVPDEGNYPNEEPLPNWEGGEYASQLKPVYDRILAVYNYLVGCTPVEKPLTRQLDNEYVILSDVWDGSGSGNWWDWIFGTAKPDQPYYCVLARFKLTGDDKQLNALELEAKLMVDGQEAVAQNFDLKAANPGNTTSAELTGPDANGYYTVKFLYPLTAAQVEGSSQVVLTLSGNQTVEDTYLYYPYKDEDTDGRTHSQALVGRGHGLQTIDDTSTLSIDSAKWTISGKKYRHSDLSKVPYEFKLEQIDDSGNAVSSFPAVTVKNDDSGSFSFPAISYVNPGTYRYKVTEVIPAGADDAEYDQGHYIVTVTVSKSGSVLLVNDTPTIQYYADSSAAGQTQTEIAFVNRPTITFTVNKVWAILPEDAALKPDAVSVILYENNIRYGEPVTLSEANGWSYTWEDLNPNSSWRVQEESLDNFASSTPETFGPDDLDGKSGHEAIITNSSLTTTVSARKVWNLQPYHKQTPVTLQLVMDGKPVEGKSVMLPINGNQWWCTWLNLERGHTWKVQEVNVPDGMTSSVEVTSNGRDFAFVVTNTGNVEKADYTVQKTWSLEEYQTKEPVQVKLFYSVDGEDWTQYGDEVTLNEANSWSHTWSQLETGYQWKVEEVNVPEGMTVTCSGPAKNGEGYQFTINNATNVTKKQYSVRKDWNLKDYDAALKREIEVQLYRAEGDGAPAAYGEKVKLNQANNWSHSFGELDAHYTWSVEEVSSIGHVTTAYTTETDDATGAVTLVITNTSEAEKADYSVTKVWELAAHQTAPESVQVQLYYSLDGTNWTQHGAPVTLNADNRWHHTWENLETGYIWKVEETSELDHIISTVSPAKSEKYEAQSFTITNTTDVESGNYSVTKEWKLKPYQTEPASVQVQLYKAVGDGAATAEGEPVELNESNNWTYTWENLDKGYVWSVKEVGLPNDMIATIVPEKSEKGSTADFTITNTTKVSYADYSVTKKYAENIHTHRHQPISVALYRSVNGKDEIKYGSSVTLSRENGWRYVWERLDSGYTWRVEEENLPENMEAAIVGPIDVTEEGDLVDQKWFEITNCYTYVPVDITVHKQWSIADEGMIPENVKMTLYRNGVEWDTVILTREMDWSYVWDGLDAGYEWTVKETEVPDGMVSEVERVGNTFVVINRDAPKLPVTGDSHSPALLAWLSLLALTAFGALLRRKRA